MAKRAMMTGMTRIDRAFVSTMLGGLTLALIQYAQTLALPAHFA